MDEPPPFVKEKVHIIFKLFIQYMDMFESIFLMYYGQSQCALHHSILSFVKLFFDMNIQEKYGWIICYKLFCTSCHPGTFT